MAKLQVNLTNYTKFKIVNLLNSGTNKNESSINEKIIGATVYIRKDAILLGRPLVLVFEDKDWMYSAAITEIVVNKDGILSINDKTFIFELEEI